MRIGQIVKVVEDRKFGFIRSEHFREDVFFHFSSLQGLNPKRIRIGQDVEFEIDELMRINKQKLEATIVQEPARPLSFRLEEEAIDEYSPSHHPKARRRKPKWKRRLSKPGEEDLQDPENALESSGTTESRSDAESPKDAGIENESGRGPE